MASVQMPQTQPAIPPMGFGEAIGTCFSKYITFNGRARRAEYWYWTLFVFLLQFAIAFLGRLTGHAATATSVSQLVSILLLLPGLAVFARRMHDTDRSGWWFLLCFTIIGVFVLLVWLCQEGTKGTNRFGPRTT